MTYKLSKLFVWFITHLLGKEKSWCLRYYDQRGNVIARLNNTGYYERFKYADCERNQEI